MRVAPEPPADRSLTAGLTVAARDRRAQRRRTRPHQLQGPRCARRQRSTRRTIGAELNQPAPRHRRRPDRRSSRSAARFGGERSRVLPTPSNHHPHVSRDRERNQPCPRHPRPPHPTPWSSTATKATSRTSTAATRRLRDLHRRRRPDPAVRRPPRRPLPVRALGISNTTNENMHIEHGHRPPFFFHRHRIAPSYATGTSGWSGSATPRSPPTPA